MNILPVILGTDINSYGVARSFHEAYGIKSLALGRKPLTYTRHSKIVDVEVTKDFNTEAVFLKKIKEVVERFKDDPRQLILIPCSDGYNSLVSKHRDELSKYFLLNVNSLDLQEHLENKKNFYEVCEQYGLDYPDTVILDKDNYKDIAIPMDYPLALKPNDSIAYLKIDFPGKKKAFKISDAEEMQATLNKIYQAGYTGEMIVQDFVPGNHSVMYVLNAYVNQNSEVKMMSLGKCLLDECLPTEIGNYNALLTLGNMEIYQQYKQFLEAINYKGYANFDLKYDVRDGKFKVFEINLRQGRSSYYMNAGGCNFIKYLVDDLVFHKDEPTYYHEEHGLWLYVDPLVLRKYADPRDKDLVNKYLKEGYEFTQWYKEDRNIWRFLDYMRRRLSTIKYYPKYQPLREKK